MNTTETRLVVSDLDNTLLRSDKSVSKRTLKILEQCRSRGMRVGFATNRSEQASADYIRRILPDFIISDGGARVRIGERVVYRRTLPANTTNMLLHELINNDFVSKITVETDDGFYANCQFGEATDYAHARDYDFHDPLNAEAYKITFEAFDKHIARQIAEKFDDCSFLSFSSEPWHRFAHIEATKWNAMEVLLDCFSLKAENVCSFGDDTNDVEMIAKSGIGVAVGNGVKEVKDVADYITDENDKDGVANYLEYLLLKC